MDDEKGIPASPMAPLMVQLFYDRAPRVDMERLTEKVEAYCGRVDPAQRPRPQSESAQYFMLDALAHFDEGDLPSQLCLSAPTPVAASDLLETALQQTWEWEEAGKVVSECTHVMMVNDLMAANVDRGVRSRQFRGFLRAIQEVAPCRAMHWLNSQVVIDPQRFVFQQGETIGAQMHGSINVRLFNIEGTEGDVVMDSLGLGVLGLPDVQCHFRDLPPSDVAGVLYMVACYMFDKGDLIEDGNTIPGIKEEDEWLCQHEMALVGPERMVLDLDPGPPFAAGGRAG
jgi:hypothetical protein